MGNSGFHRPEGRSVWTGKDLAVSREWLVPLPRETLAEIDNGVARLKGRNLGFESLTPADLPLTTFSRQIAELRDEIANGRGFAVLQGLDIAKYTLDELKMIYWCFGLHFGTPTPQSFLGDLIGDIMDLTDEEPDPKRRRGYHSGGAQATHTDATDIVSMLSLRVAKAGGESRLCSVHAVHNLMLDTCPGLLRQFYDGFLFRVPDSDAEALGESPFPNVRRPAFRYGNGKLTFAFVRGYVDRGVRAGDYKLSPVEQAALEAFEAFSNHPDICLDYILAPGDIQIFNNRTVLHGRKHFDDHPEKSRRRHLLRLWLTVPEWPPLAAEQETHSTEAMRQWRKNAQRRKTTVA